MPLKKIISGFQDGADIAGIFFAKEHGYETGGYMPFGFRTSKGPKRCYSVMYGAQEDNSPDYPPRTERNVKDSDGTVRFAFDFDTPGEKCTLKYIKQHGKPYHDVSLMSLDTNNVRAYLRDFNNFLLNNNIETLNIAGNNRPHVYSYTLRFLRLWYDTYGKHNR